MAYGIDNPNRFTFVDSLQPDGSIERVYSNRTRERRTVEAVGVIRWSDSNGISGRDIYLGDGRIRREDSRGVASEGQHLGNGVTVWNNGQYLTVNQTALPEPPSPVAPRPGGVGGLLMGLGLGGLFGLSAASGNPFGVDPNSGEYGLYAEEMARQEQLRRMQQQQGSGYDSTSGSSDGGSSDDNWSDNSDSGGDWGGTDSFG